MALEIKVPSVGESISEVQIGEWYIPEGKWVAEDVELVGLETDKATFDVPAPAGGTITRILKNAGDTAQIGDVIGYFEEAPQPEGAEDDAPQPAESSASQAGNGSPAPAASSPTPASSQSESIVMPAAQRELAQRGLSAGDVTATGPGGRLLKEDVQQHTPSASGDSFDAEVPNGPVSAAFRTEETVPMSPMRKRIAERLVEAQQTAALLTTFNEADMTAIKHLRAKYKDAFLEKYGVKLGFMSFFVRAVVDALNEYPQVGAKIKDHNLVYSNFSDIGIAVGGGKGLVVPVLRNAERLSFAEIELAINDFAKRAAKNKISLAELEGGTFTISNGGVYGSMLSTPIVNPPQSAVLGMHNIVDRPWVVDGEIVVRPIMYLALTYDHRVVDGREAVSFLKRIKETLEEPTRLVLEV